LLSSGGTEQLKDWLNHSDPGSSLRIPAVYIFAGVFGAGEGTGVELFTPIAWNDPTPMLAEQEILFYKVPGANLYTLGAGTRKVESQADAQGDTTLKTKGAGH